MSRRCDERVLLAPENVTINGAVRHRCGTELSVLCREHGAVVIFYCRTCFEHVALSIDILQQARASGHLTSYESLS